jgi:hypothetical protein
MLKLGSMRSEYGSSCKPGFDHLGTPYLVILHGYNTLKGSGCRDSGLDTEYSVEEARLSCASWQDLQGCLSM